jgi:putative addiction module component (TIGR02574 family)
VTNATQSVFDAALALSEQERATLAQLLLESVSEDSEDVHEAELLAELDRRRADLERGTADVVRLEGPGVNAQGSGTFFSVNGTSTRATRRPV